MVPKRKRVGRRGRKIEREGGRGIEIEREKEDLEWKTDENVLHKQVSVRRTK